MQGSGDRGVAPFPCAGKGSAVGTKCNRQTNTVHHIFAIRDAITIAGVESTEHSSATRCEEAGCKRNWIHEHWQPEDEERYNDDDLNLHQPLSLVNTIMCTL